MRANNSDHNSSFSWLYEININGTGVEKKGTPTTNTLHYGETIFVSVKGNGFRLFGMARLAELN